MNGVREAMIVAGGAGTRLWPLTANRPKPLVHFCGAPLATGLLRRLAIVGVERVLLVVGRDPSPFEVLRDDARTMGIELEAVAEPEPLDTAGGVRAALDRVTGTFLVLNGDIVTDVDLDAPIARHHAVRAVATLVLTRVPDTSTFGVCVLEDTRVAGFVEKPPPGTLPGHDTVNAGTYVLEPDALEDFHTGRLSFEREVFPGLVADGRHVEGWVSDAVWADLGTPARYLDGHRLALDGALRWPILDDVPGDDAGVRIGHGVQIAPDAQVRGPVLLADGALIAGGATVGPHVVIGAGGYVGARATVRHSVTGPGTRVGEDAVLDGVITGHDSIVGVRVDARHGAVLGDRNEVADGLVLGPGASVPTRE